MNFLLFNNGIIVSDGGNVHHLAKDDKAKNVLASIQEARVCVVDVDVLIAAAVESPIEKKDSILVRKFNELYQHEAYVIQDERIDNNLFQVIGIKEQKVREVYSFLPPQKVESFIPYGIALRNALFTRNIDLNKTIVFVDDLGSERLLTVFDGLKFSRTRVIVNNGEDILPEIKRSQIDFLKKNEDYLRKKGTDFVILVNNRELAIEITKNIERIPVEYLDLSYPALEGLKEINTPIKYVLPEEILKKRRDLELKNNLTALVLSLFVVTTGLSYFMFNKIELELVSNKNNLLKQTNKRLEEQLRVLDQETYREDLKKHKYLNYGVSYLKIVDLVPSNYTINSFKFIKSNRWNLEMSLFDDGGVLEPIPHVRILKDADIKDIFVNNQLGETLADNFMNKIVVVASLMVAGILANLGVSVRTQSESVRSENEQLEANNDDARRKIKDKEILVKSDPVSLSEEFGLVMNQIRILESYSGTSMNLQLETGTDVDDVADHYENTEYKGVRGLKLRVIVDKFSKETDMGAVLDDVHLLEKNTDFSATEISKDNNHLIVKGEVYGL